MNDISNRLLLGQPFDNVAIFVNKQPACESKVVVRYHTSHKWVSSFLTAHQHILGHSVPFIHSVLFTVW